MTSVGSFDNLIQCSVHNASAGTPAQQHTIISSGLRREGPAHSPIAAATDYFADCDTCMTRLVQITKQLSDRVQANTIRLGAFMHLFVELFQNEYRADAKRFYTKHVACLAHPTGNSAVLDLLANSIKCGQLDKRLVKLRQAKTCVRVDWRFSRHLQNIFEVCPFPLAVFVGHIIFFFILVVLQTDSGQQPPFVSTVQQSLLHFDFGRTEPSDALCIAHVLPVKCRFDLASSVHHAVFLSTSVG